MIEATKIKVRSNKQKLWIQLLLKHVLVVACTFIAVNSYGQIDPTDSLPDDPGALKAYTYQNMNFGTFTNGGTGGSITLSNTGSRSQGGSIILLNSGTPAVKAIFEIEAAPNSIVSISNGPDVTLTNGGTGSLSLIIGEPDLGSPFTTTAAPPLRTQVSFGGVLTIGNSTASPPGNYTGTIYITFNQE